MDKRDLVKIDVPAIPFFFLSLSPLSSLSLLFRYREIPETAQAAKILLFVSFQGVFKRSLENFLARSHSHPLLPPSSPPPSLPLPLFGANKEIREDSSAR